MPNHHENQPECQLVILPLIHSALTNDFIHETGNITDITQKVPHNMLFQHTI